jgi:hypothetical protein
VTVTGTAYHYFVHLLAVHPGTRFSDNYFDLALGEVRQIVVSNEATMLDPSALSVRSFQA